ILKAGPAALLLLATAACSPGGVVGRSAPFSAPEAGAPGEIRVAAALAGLSIQVPAELVVSESQGYYPGADIVWHGDPFGDRRAQIATIFQEAADRAATLTAGAGRAVRADARLVRFHGLSPRARLTVGGVHNSIYDLTLRDAATGAVLETRRVDASIRAFGGIAAVRAESLGQTQRVRVTEAIAASLVEEMRAGIAAPAPAADVAVTRALPL
ncbi:MAG: DUF6778 family protein, partial [Hasllibacter sp.]